MKIVPALETAADAETCVLPWVYASVKPYLDCLFEGIGDPKEPLREWLRGKDSEFSLKSTELAIVDEQVVGGFIALDGPGLARARKADLLSLLRLSRQCPEAPLLQRLADLRVESPPRGAGECYLRAIGLRAEWRGKGLGHKLLEHFIGFGQAQNFRTLSLDVYEENQPAVRTYEKAGFTVETRQYITRLGLTVLGMKLTLPPA